MIPTISIHNLSKEYTVLYEVGRWLVAFAVTVPAEAVVGRLTSTALLGTVGLALLLIGARVFWRICVYHYSGASA
jgi:ABC-type uncharacterized transport system permease subunit